MFEKPRRQLPSLQLTSADLPGVTMLRARRSMAFTLTELLVAVAIMTVILVLLSSMTNLTASVWSNTGAKIEQFRAARNAFESLTDHLSQATLNTYWDYNNPSNPTQYIRQSELRFISGPATSGSAPLLTGTNPTHAIFFQAPLGFTLAPVTGGPDYTGLQNVLSTLGYYIQFGSDAALRPPFVTTPYRWRFRLMEAMEPSNDLTLYNYTSGTNSNGLSRNISYTTHEWFTNMLYGNNPSTHVLAENIIALLFLPMLAPQDEQSLITSGSIPAATVPGTALAPYYSYDSTVSSTNAALNSKSQLPPVVQVVMVAINEASAVRIQSGSTAMPALIPASLFTSAAKLNGAGGDLSALQNSLIQQHINFRVFISNVSISGAKWSFVQSN